MELWPRAWAGAQPTASVLDSPVSLPSPRGELLLIDLTTRKERTIAQGRFDDLRLSPRRTYVEAVRARERVVPRSDESTGYRPYERYEATVFRAEDLPQLSFVSEVGSE